MARNSESKRPPVKNTGEKCSEHSSRTKHQLTSIRLIVLVNLTDDSRVSSFWIYLIILCGIMVLALKKKQRNLSKFLSADVF